MKKIVPIGVIIGIALQLILLSLFLNNKLFQFSDIVFHLVWLIFSMVGILFSWKYFRQNKDKKFPLITLSTVVFGEIIVFQFLLVNLLLPSIICIMVVFILHFSNSDEYRFDIFPIISFTSGAFLICLLVLMKYMIIV